MSVPRFFISPESIDALSRVVSIDHPALVKQIKKVLRMRNKDRLDILDGKGNIYHCLVRSMTKRAVEATIEGTDGAKGDPLVTVTVALPLIKAARFEWALEKLTELGVAKIVPMLSERSIVRWQDKKERWHSIIREAAEQSERATIPQLVAPQPFRRFIESKTGSSRDGEKFLCAERIGEPLLKNVLCNLGDSRSCLSDISIIVGAEGGFTPYELAFARDHQVSLVSLGKRILRSETAAICATALVISFFDDFP